MNSLNEPALYHVKTLNLESINSPPLGTVHVISKCKDDLKLFTHVQQSQNNQSCESVVVRPCMAKHIIRIYGLIFFTKNSSNIKSYK